MFVIQINKFNQIKLIELKACSYVRLYVYHNKINVFFVVIRSLNNLLNSQFIPICTWAEIGSGLNPNQAARVLILSERFYPISARKRRIRNLL